MVSSKRKSVIVVSADEIMKHAPTEPLCCRATGSDKHDAADAVRVLQSMVSYGRIDALLCLIGLLAYLPQDNWDVRGEVVEALGGSPSEQTRSLLFGELRRVQPTNTTRRYLDRVIKTISRFPQELIHEEAERFKNDTSVSRTYRQKLAEALEAREGKTRRARDCSGLFDDDPL